MGDRRAVSLDGVAAASASADLHAEHNHDRSREMTDEGAEEPPQAHGFRIGRTGTIEHPPGRELTRDSHEPN